MSWAFMQLDYTHSCELLTFGISCLLETEPNTDSRHTNLVAECVDNTAKRLRIISASSTFVCFYISNVYIMSPCLAFSPFPS